MIQPALSWQVPRRGLCFSVGTQPPAWRYVTNHAHQAELLVPILDNALGRNAAPEVLRWGWPLTHWMAQVLPAAQP